MEQINIDAIADAMGLSNSKPNTLSAYYGTVVSVAADRKSFQVVLDNSGATITCAAMCGASAGNRVLCLVMKNGQSVALGVVDATSFRMADFIEDYGLTGNWYYIKWHSGRMQEWTQIVIDRVSITTWVSPLCSSPDLQFTYSVPFKNDTVPEVWGTIDYSPCGFWLEYYGYGNNQHTPYFNLIRPSEMTAEGICMTIKAEGWWK